MTIDIPKDLYVELLTHQGKQAALTGRKPSNSDVIIAALSEYLKLPLNTKKPVSVQPTGFGEGGFIPNLSSIIGNYPDLAAVNTNEYPITRMAPTREEVGEKLDYMRRRREAILNGELDHEAVGDIDD